MQTERETAMPYVHLTYFDRCEIQSDLERGSFQRKIAAPMDAIGRCMHRHATSNDKNRRAKKRWTMPPCATTWKNSSKSNARPRPFPSCSCWTIPTTPACASPTKAFINTSTPTKKRAANSTKDCAKGTKKTATQHRQRQPRNNPQPPSHQRTPCHRR